MSSVEVICLYIRDSAKHRGVVEVGIDQPWECRVCHSSQGSDSQLGRKQEDHI